ncbi:uncharacterized protein PAC_07651 [Phialocephala subalpina]|uniref:Uncharacterized protein n=1 Tax=Phialocephala subalpina TaxID=576137 RepID=A0A1L7WYB4_9HELO|nr:uncharacterized protein PAC_07651 [Phialocephala subalpina]
MAIFQDLPNELVTRILTLNAEDIRKLAILREVATTCRWVHLLVRPLMYNNISFSALSTTKEIDNHNPSPPVLPNRGIGLRRKFTTKKLSCDPFMQDSKPEPTTKDRTPESRSLFLRSLEENPDLADMVHHLRIPCKLPTSEHSRINLSMMKALKPLNCAAACFFESEGAYSLRFDSRMGLYRLLPVNMGT